MAYGAACAGRLVARKRKLAPTLIDLQSIADASKQAQGMPLLSRARSSRPSTALHWPGTGPARPGNATCNRQQAACMQCTCATDDCEMTDDARTSAFTSCAQHSLYSS